LFATRDLLNAECIEKSAVPKSKLSFWSTKIEMHPSLLIGATSPEVTNVGNVIHKFEVEGNEISREFEADLKPGAT
jgi:hypothetical protein